MFWEFYRLLRRTPQKRYLGTKFRFYDQASKFLKSKFSNTAESKFRSLFKKKKRKKEKGDLFFSKKKKVSGEDCFFLKKKEDLANWLSTNFLNPNIN